jgi:ribonucleotide reductase beta subunit family protein with ferritin-like domain
MKWSVRDESLHSKMGCQLFRQMCSEFHELLEEEKADKIVTNSDLKIAMQEIKIDLIKWVTPFFLTTILLIVGLWFK